MKTKIKLRKKLCADGLIETTDKRFKKIKDYRQGNTRISLNDALMSAYAMFVIKSPSMLNFTGSVKDKNLNKIFHINDVPSETQMRKILDNVNPDDIKPLYKDIFRDAQRGKCLENMEFLNGHYLVSVDGTGYFSSSNIKCPNCLVKKSSKTGKIIFHHQMLGASIVHPNSKEVIPLCPEPIIKQDGETKNDCERNAGKRFLKQFRKDHPNLKTIIIEDALGANAPHIKNLQKRNCRYIIGAKQDGNKFLFKQAENEFKKGNVQEFGYEEKTGKFGTKKTTLGEITITHKFRFINQISLNKSNQNLLVNFIEYWETKSNGKKQYFSWITDIEITKDNVSQIMRGGRARWKIENETFNTLKNQGYNLEHNYGHGHNNLSTILAMLMMLAFLADQIQQIACPLFKATLIKIKRKIYFWEKMKHWFYEFRFNSMQQIFELMLYGSIDNIGINYENSE